MCPEVFYLKDSNFERFVYLKSIFGKVRLFECKSANLEVLRKFEYERR